MLRVHKVEAELDCQVDVWVRWQACNWCHVQNEELALHAQPDMSMIQRRFLQQLTFNIAQIVDTDTAYSTHFLTRYALVVNDDDDIRAV